MNKCDDLIVHEGTTGAMIIQTMIAWASQYNECKTRHNALVDVINVKDKP